MANSFDTQANGWRDDGSESGVLRTELARGNLVLRPLPAADFSIVTAGSGVCNPVADGGGSRCGNQYAFLSVPDAASFVGLTFSFNGRALGLCYSTTSTPGTKNASAIIDGVAYPLPPAPRKVLDPADCNPGAGYHYYPVAENLADGPHQCTLAVTGDAAGAAQIVYLYGIFVEERVGNRPAPPSAALANSALVTTAARQTLNALFAYNNAANYISAIHLANVSGADCLVTLDKNSVAFWREIVSANKTREINFPLPVAISFNYGIACQSANAIQTSLWGYAL
ncbi:MAG: hypothetical protein IT426_12055 [Pirellulales bacterium]|nr:hypothetical protein [Pirellulales bacterium]